LAFETVCHADLNHPKVRETNGKGFSLIRLQQRPFVGLLVNPFGRTARVIELDGDHLRITQHGQVVSM